MLDKRNSQFSAHSATTTDSTKDTDKHESKHIAGMVESSNPRLSYLNSRETRTYDQYTFAQSNAHARRRSDLDEPIASSKYQKIRTVFDSPEGPLLLTDWESPSTAFIEACKGKIDRSIEDILPDGGSKHARKAYFGLKAIHIATIHGQSEAVETLLNYGADIEACTGLTVTHSTYAGWRPLHFAVRRGDFSMTELLLRRGAEVSAQTVHGSQPIHIWAANCDRLDILRTLLVYSARINAESAAQKTPLQLAREFSKVEMTRGLFNWGAEIDLEPLLKSMLTKLLRSSDSVVLQELMNQRSYLKARTPKSRAAGVQLFSVTSDDVDGVQSPSLDMEFLRLFLTLNPYENARTELSYNVVSRFYVGIDFRLSPTTEEDFYSYENLRLRDFIATFDGTTQLHRGEVVASGTKRGREDEEDENDIDTLYFTVSRDRYKVRMIAVLGDPSLQEQ